MATIMIGSARIDERGKLSGGSVGDQKQTSSANEDVYKRQLNNSTKMLYKQ